MEGSFSLNVAKWVQGTKKELDELHRAIIYKLFTAVILDTPVLEGRLRGNWIISSDNPASGVFDIIDKNGNQTTKKVEDFVTNLNFSEKEVDIYLTNNLPYAYGIEMGNSTIKAPEGMVRKNILRISQNLNNL